MTDICLPIFLKETFSDFIFQEQDDVQIPEEDEFKRIYKDLLETKLKLNDISQDFDEKVAEDRLTKINRIEKDIKNHRLKIDKLKICLNKLNSKIEPLMLEVETLKEIQLDKSEKMKFLLHKYKSSLDIHLAFIPYCDNGYFLIQVSYFTTVRLDNPKYFIKLLYHKNSKSWQLIDMQPQPKNFKKIVEHLMLFQDIQGCFEAVRRIFLKYKK